MSFQVMSVMTVTPKVFYTLDLRRVLKHLATGGSYETIPPPPVVPNIEITTPSANIRDGHCSLLLGAAFTYGQYFGNMDQGFGPNIYRYFC